MGTRVIEVSRRGSRVGVDAGRLAVERDGETAFVPIGELEAVVLAERAVGVARLTLPEAE